MAEPLQLRMEICDANGAHIDNQVLTTLETKLRKVPRITADRSIYRVPKLLRSVNSKAYTPQLVSIGPFHHGNPNLRPMEIHKLRYLQDFLDRDKKKTMKFYFENLKGCEERARQHYDEHVKLADNKFVEMMLIDGCFVIEFMLREMREMSFVTRNNHDFLQTAPSMSQGIMVDMQLLENQLPFFVIEYLFNLLNNNPHGPFWQFSFRDLAFEIFSQNSLQLCLTDPSNNHVKHFVDFIRKSCVPSSETEKYNLSSESKEPENVELIPIASATELDQAGVKFEKSTNTAECFLDIRLRKKKGVLTMCIPKIYVEDGTEILFRNLIALDFFNNHEDNYVTGYIYLLDELISTPQDVALLRRKGIIDNWLGNDDEVSRFVNKLGTWTSTGDQFHYAELRKNVNAYCKKRRHEWRAMLMREYFNTPWSTASVVAAIILLVSTIVQTVVSLIKT